jgi:hypothetical protein
VGYSVDQRVPENDEDFLSATAHCFISAALYPSKSKSGLVHKHIVKHIVKHSPSFCRVLYVEHCVSANRGLKRCRVFKHALFRGFVRICCIVERESFSLERVPRFQGVILLLYAPPRRNTLKRCGVGFMMIMVVMMIAVGMRRGLGGEDEWADGWC